MSEIKLSWSTKFLLKFFPQIAMHLFAHKMGIKKPLFDQFHQVFTQTNRIDLLPLSGDGSRGFILVVNRKTALWFFQEGDHFIYDGYEMACSPKSYRVGRRRGAYNKGDVTIFDQVK